MYSLFKIVFTCYTKVVFNCYSKETITIKDFILYLRIVHRFSHK